MKELSIEQKAKAYDEAIKKATALYKASEPMSGCNVIIETLFPELKESEDEKVEKAIFGMVYDSDNELWSSYDVTKSDVLAWLEKQGEQNPAEWTEEDDKVRTTIINEFEQCSEWCCANGLTKEDCIDWLQLLKGRVQPKQEWSEEDEQILQGIWDEILANKHDAKECEWKTYDKFLDWLKSLRPQKCLILSKEEIEKAAQEWDSKANFNPFYMTMDGNKPTGVKQDITTHEESFKAGVNWILKSLKGRVQSKQEWSDEDSYYINNIIHIIEEINNAPLKRGEDWEAYINWLKSLRPQNRWKPSDEQMEALDWQVENTSVSSWQYKATKELMEDLKKLKEE